MSSTTQTSVAAPSDLTGLLHSHRILQFSGPDAATFLQGYLTCDTDLLDPHKALPGAFTNLKGRVVANGWVWGEARDVKMLVSTELTDTCAEFLKPYLNFAKTSLTCQPDAPGACLSTEQAPGTEQSKAQIEVGTDKYVLAKATQGAAQNLNDNTTSDISEAWLGHTIDQKEVVVTAATSGTLLPQMLGLTELGAVSFEKGCYLGQEVIARAQHRGAVKRRLQRIAYRCDQALPAGATLDDETGKRVAVVINATQPTPPSAQSAKALVVSSVTEQTAGRRWSYAGTTIELVD